MGYLLPVFQEPFHSHGQTPGIRAKSSRETALLLSAVAPFLGQLHASLFSRTFVFLKRPLLLNHVSRAGMYHGVSFNIIFY